MPNSKKRALCISDSLGLPRDGVDYDQTWYSQLKSINQTFEFIPLFRRNETTNCLATENYKEYLLWYTPNLVVLQLGICDCAPRYIRVSSLLYKIVYRLPSCLKSIFWKLYKCTHKRTIKNADVPPLLFEQNIDNYCQACQEYGLEQLVIIKIATPTQAMVASNPTIIEAIKLYNAILQDIAQKYQFCVVVNPLNEPSNSNYVSDGYHPNGYGNRLVAMSINAVII